MKILLSIFLVFVTTISGAVILGRDRCTYGPSYWCSNITNAKGCGAVKHCIKTVWEKQHVPVDTDSICQICLDMVKQARDQLESNETMEEIKEVFDGSCDLIPIGIVKKECKRLADDFIPELVEALSSQMNPQVVCSTAGLCNNAAIDKLLENYEAEKKLFSCDKCNDVGHVISQKFHTTSRDQVLDGFLSACGRLSSFSDACSSIVLTYFDNIYAELSKNLKADNICHMSGACASKYHNHANVEIKTESDSGYVMNDDIPCELCEQLVTHLRDVLIANTTEAEFKSVLQGLCSQTKGFKQECISIVDQYYQIIYESLVNNLDANGICFLIGICHKGNEMHPHSPPHMPLLPAHQKISPPKRRLGQNEKVYTNDEIKSMVLPIDQLMGAKTSLDLVDGGEKCAICTYFFHFVQEELSNDKNEDELKEMVKKTCEKFPKSLQPSCDSFVDLYGDAIIALLVQSIDPRDVCPQLKLCPKNINQDVDIFAPNTVHVEINEESKPTCPLCELVVTQARQYIDSSKSKESAKKALKKVCKVLPPKPQLQCDDFVETYYDELLDKLLSDLTPKGVCELLKLCPGRANKFNEDDIKVGIEKINFIPHSINTNEIPDFTIEGQAQDSGECMLCTSVVGGAESKISQGMSKQDIENILLAECSKFRPYQGICDNFVQSNVDQIIDLLSRNMSPKQICQKLSLCAIDDDMTIDEAVIINVVAIPVSDESKKIIHVPLTNSHQDNGKKSIKDDPICIMCEFVMTKLEQELKDKHTQEEIKEAVENICTIMPKSVSKQCTKFIDEYAALIISLIDTVPPKEICVEMSLCLPAKKHMHLVGESECTWGPTHFCGDVKIAEKCKATEYCKRQKVGAFAE